MIRNVETLRDERFDLLILGGGITGAGVALDATLRGLRVALIDKGDFASGTSSVSSKLVHGGLRYLEHGDFHLVYEALHERRLLLQNASHLVRPLQFIIPYYKGARVSPWKWRTGLTLYDLLAGGSNLRRSRPVRLGSLPRQLPELRTAGLTGASAYFDAQMDDARLCLCVIRTAALHGAYVANYVEATTFEQRGGQIVGARVLDRLGGKEISIRARQVLNVTGPWIDAVCRLAGDASGPRLQPTKGVHLVAPGRGLSAAFLLLHPADGRVFFVIPWLGKTLIGTTDTLCAESPDKLGIADSDIDYLLAGHNHYFDRAIASSDLLGSFVGLRPLIRARQDEPSAISREFQIFASSNGLLSVAGGKYTTYRRMAEIITERIARRLGCRRHGSTRACRIDGAPAGPWKDFEAKEIVHLQRHYALPEESARHLVRRYGERGRDVAGYGLQDPALTDPVVAGEPDLRMEFSYQRDHEMAVKREDFLLRRTRLGLFCPHVLDMVQSW